MPPKKQAPVKGVKAKSKAQEKEEQKIAKKTKQQVKGKCQAL